MDPRLERLLGGETLAALRKRLRQRYERGVPAEVLRLGALSEAEHTALAALCGRPARPVRSMQIKVAEIDAALTRAGLASSLRDALEQLDGPIIDTTAQRLQVRVQWQQLVEGCAHPALAAVLQTSVGLGLLKRLCASQPEAGERLLLDANQVLRRNRSLSGVLLPPPSARNNPSDVHHGGVGSDQGDSDQQQVAAA